MSNNKQQISGMSSVSSKAVLYAMTLAAMSAAPDGMAGSYFSADKTEDVSKVDEVTHPIGYTGSGGVLNLEVCIATTSESTAEMEQSVKNMVAVYNEMRPTTGNTWTDSASSGGTIPSGSIDFESAALHEMGHCLGMSHPNLASESGLPEPNANHTSSTKGVNGTFDLNAGADGIIGSADDQRGDDVNYNWFRKSNNNPFTIAQIVDSTTYARDTAFLPASHSFAANGDRALSVALVNGGDTTKKKTETVMQQMQYLNEIQRSLAPEDVATLRYAMSGIDEIAGNADDYTIRLTYGGIKDGCNINIKTNAATALASCSASWSSISGNHTKLGSATINIAPATDVSWHFNTAAPCSANIPLTANTWKMISLPCQVGLSVGSKVSAVFGDDFGAGTYGSTWIVYARDEANNTYTPLTADSELEEGVGYWIYTTETGKTVDVEGQYSAQIDVPLTGAAGGRWNMVGYPFEGAGTVNWADVRVIEEATGDIKTLAQVDPAIMSRIMYKWGGSSYSPFDGQTTGMQGTLGAGEGLWVRVFQPGYALRVPRP